MKRLPVRLPSPFGFGLNDSVAKLQALDAYISLIYYARVASKQKSKFAILGLLSWKPMSGYDIKKLVDVGLSHFWNENYGQIYPTLESLVKEKLVTKKAERKSGKRRRFVYTITSSGQRAFDEWLHEPTSGPIVRNELQLKFFLCSQRPVKDSVRLITEYQRQQRTMLDEYRRSEQVLRLAIEEDRYDEELDEILDMTTDIEKIRAKQCQMFYLTLRHGIRMVEARLAWCEEVLKSLHR